MGEGKMTHSHKNPVMSLMDMEGLSYKDDRERDGLGCHTYDPPSRTRQRNVCNEASKKGKLGLVDNDLTTEVLDG
jgi:hypothetical protein